MFLIPAIDLLGGRCVRLTQGDYAREQVYDGKPEDVARRFFDEGAKWLHVVDLDGARSGRIQNMDSIEAVVLAFGGSVEVGGGVRSLKTARDLLAVGAARVILGTKLVAQPDAAGEILRELGERAVAGIDAREGFVAVSGWQELSGVDGVVFAQQAEKLGAQRIIVTDIGTDGMLSGPNFEFLRRVVARVNVPLIASGGVSCLKDLALLSEIGGIEAVIVGKAIYEGVFSVPEAVGLLESSA